MDLPEKITIYGDPDGWVFGIRAAKTLSGSSVGATAAFSYGEPGEWSAYVKRNTSGITAYVERSAPSSGERVK